MSEERWSLRRLFELAWCHGRGGDGSLTAQAEGCFGNVYLGGECAESRDDLGKRHDCREDEEEEEEGTAKERRLSSFGRQLRRCGLTV